MAVMSPGAITGFNLTTFAKRAAPATYQEMIFIPMVEDYGMKVGTTGTVQEGSPPYLLGAGPVGQRRGAHCVHARRRGGHAHCGRQRHHGPVGRQLQSPDRHCRRDSGLGRSRSALWLRAPIRSRWRTCRRALRT